MNKIHYRIYTLKYDIMEIFNANKAFLEFKFALVRFDNLRKKSDIINEEKNMIINYLNLINCEIKRRIMEWGTIDGSLENFVIKETFDNLTIENAIDKIETYLKSLNFWCCRNHSITPVVQNAADFLNKVLYVKHTDDDKKRVPNAMSNGVGLFDNPSDSDSDTDF